MIKKRDEQTYLVRIFLGRDSVTNKRTWHTETVRDDLKTAKARERELQDQYANGTLVKTCTKSFNEYLVETWFPTAKLKLKARTLQDYQAIWATHIKEGLGRLPLAKVTPLAIQALYNALAEKGRSPRTVRNVHSVVSSSLKQAVLWRLLSHNPAERVQLPNLRRGTKKRALPLEVCHQFLKASQEMFLGIAFRYSLESGCRPQEVFALTWPDLDWNTRTATIDKALFWPKTSAKAVVSSTKTEGSERRVGLSAHLMEDLKRHQSEQLEKRRFLGADWEGTGEYIFTNKLGGIVSPTVYRKAFKAILKKADLPKTIRVYDLRHSMITLCMGSVNPKLVADRVGHSTTQLTMDTYSHAMPHQQAEVGEKIGNLLHGDKPGEGGFFSKQELLRLVSDNCRDVYSIEEVAAILQLIQSPPKESAQGMAPEHRTDELILG